LKGQGNLTQGDTDSLIMIEQMIQKIDESLGDEVPVLTRCPSVQNNSSSAVGFGWGATGTALVRVGPGTEVGVLALSGASRLLSADDLRRHV
jgi:hypothetical protein